MSCCMCLVGRTRLPVCPALLARADRLLALRRNYLMPVLQRPEPSAPSLNGVAHHADELRVPDDAVRVLITGFGVRAQRRCSS